MHPKTKEVNHYKTLMYMIIYVGDNYSRFKSHTPAVPNLHRQTQKLKRFVRCYRGVKL